MSRNQFVVSAESVQGNAGAEVTFKALKMREVREYRTLGISDGEVLKEHLMSWSGFVDDNDKALPSPADDPEVLGELYLHEQQALARLLFQGPDEENAKN